MKKEYTNYVSTLDYLNSGEMAVEKCEKELIDDMKNIYKLDRVNSILGYIFENNTSFRQLLRDIDKEIERLSISESTEEENCITKREDLIELKESIIDYLSSQSVSIKEEKESIIKKCLPAISLGSRDLFFFGEKFVSKKDGELQLNNTSIDRVYSILGDSFLTKEIVDGVRLMNTTDRHKRILIFCTEALNNKEVVYKNRDLIIQYNSINRTLNELRKFLKYNPYKEMEITTCQITLELNKLLSSRVKRIIHAGKINGLKNRRECLSQKIERIRNCKNNYYRLLEEKEICEKKLEEAGLLGYLKGEDNINVKCSNSHALSHRLSYIYSYEDLDDYYDFINNEVDTSISGIKSARSEEDKFFSEASDEAINLLRREKETCENLIDIIYDKKEGELSPSIALFLLRGLTLLDEVEYKDKDISLQEIGEVDLKRRVEMQRQLQYFLGEFLNIKRNKSNITK